MTLFEFMTVCMYYQPLEIIRTNDYHEEYLIAKGRKQDIIYDMEDDVFHALGFKVLIIEQLEDRIRVKVQDEYFFKSDNERWGGTENE